MTRRPDLSVTDIYKRHAAAWAGLRNRDLIERSWLDRFCALPPPARRCSTLECGSGLPIADELLRHCFAVAGWRAHRRC